MSYGFHATLSAPFDAVVTRVIDALKAEGFGVLSDIDIRKAMKEKLDKDVPAYRILGACNPPLAYKALQAEDDIGLLLPCNVTVRQGTGNEVVVSFLDPDLMVRPVATGREPSTRARTHRLLPPAHQASARPSSGACIVLSQAD